jgi:hypothetical protein
MPVLNSFVKESKGSTNTNNAFYFVTSGIYKPLNAGPPEPTTINNPIVAAKVTAEIIWLILVLFSSKV